MKPASGPSNVRLGRCAPPGSGIAWSLLVASSGWLAVWMLL